MTHLSASVAPNVNNVTSGSFPQVNQVRSGPVASAATVNVSHANSPPQVRLDGCQIPYFEASPTSDVMQRNQVLESWLRRIELHGQTDEGRIRLARCVCKNNAELVINSPQFDSILVWPHFKTLLRQKFRGTSCSNDFFTSLQRKSMRDNQTPQDFLLKVEGAVNLGARDYPLEMGDPSCLVRRVFLSGLLPYLSDFLVACDDLPLCDIAAKANKLYLARAARALVRESRRPLPVAAAADAVFGGQDAPVNKPYCTYHRIFGHTTYECREKPRGQVCWCCARTGHFRFNCPFPAGQAGEGPRPSGREFDGFSPGLVSQLVLPPKVRGAAMKIVHSSSTAAHPGVYCTYKRLQDYYWFPNALQFCRKFIQSCATCQRRKGVARGRAPLAATPLATQPFERVSVDLIELPPARNGDKYILSIVDELTRFIQLVPLADKEAHTVADALIAHYVTLLGPPQTLVSDNGGEFTGRECTFPIGMTNHQTRAGHIGGRQLDLIAARDAAVTGTQRVREDNIEAVDRRTKATPELTLGTLVIRKRQAPGACSLSRAEQSPGCPLTFHQS
ncbi:hypothetical protein C7M84_001325 [Penaeus vannamei]|uniref:RNA-directed DNA polymerase n=1 Tax=Penaeus vannamei TaxID=6689 RepID=A0A3R7PX68_PENVA|nr:hypothetical protein C7M84_001325 [Penaeus vannamei]